MKKALTPLKKVLIVISSALISVLLFVPLGIWVSDGFHREKISAEIDGNGVEVKVAHISDIHYPNSGVILAEIAKAVEDFAPDFVFLTGDIIDSHTKKEDITALGELFLRLRPYKTYAVLGNHETINSHLDYYKNLLAENGIILLENEVRLVNVKGKEIAVAGVSDKFLYDYENVKGLGGVKKEAPVLLLAHRPEKWEQYLSGAENHRPLATFSGHAHGGQLKIFGQGIYAPGYGFFPKYYDGLYKDKASSGVLIVSRGLGDSIFPFRMYNRYHLPLVTILL